MYRKILLTNYLINNILLCFCKTKKFVTFLITNEIYQWTDRKWTRLTKLIFIIVINIIIIVIIFGDIKCYILIRMIL